MTLLQGRDERERLERGARLAVTLCGQVERLLLVVVAPDHRPHATGRVVDYDHGGRGSETCDVVRGDLLDALLEVEVERGGDAEPTAEGLAGAELVDHLLAEPR